MGRLLVSFVFLLILVATAALAAVSARAEEGPREIVTAYMQAIQSRDYVKALRCLGIDVPPEAAEKIVPALERQQYFLWAVKSFRIVSVKRDGGLAEVTVEETQFKDVEADVRAFIEARMPALDRVLAWGDNVVTERFVLVRPDGRWEFDCAHSGVQLQSLVKTLMAGVRGADGSGPRPSEEDMQKEIGRFVNGIGFGQLLASFGSAAPVAPLVAAIAFPRFLQTRAEALIGACTSNLKNIGTALEMYSTDNAGRFPTQLSSLTPAYLKVVPTCPSARKDTYSPTFASATSPDAYTIMCEGHHHAEARCSPNFPQYTSTQGVLQQ